jgi:hypothetical protein
MEEYANSSSATMSVAGTGIFLSPPNILVGVGLYGIASGYSIYNPATSLVNCKTYNNHL